MYTTGRGHDSVAGFLVSRDGSLSPTSQAFIQSGGRTPWALSFASDSRLVVANQYEDEPDARKGGGPGADPYVFIRRTEGWN